MFLIDTQAPVWSALDDPRRRPAHDALLERETDLFVSVASIWEIEIKLKLGKLSLPSDFSESLAAAQFAFLPVTFDHALRAGRLPLRHRDPFDRMLIAQAQAEGLAVLTTDPSFGAYDVEVI